MKHVIFFVGCLVVVLRIAGPLLGGMMLWSASMERDRAEGVYESPSPVRFEELVSDVPLENRHVAVSDLAIGSEGYCWQPQRHHEDRVIAYVPAFSALSDTEPAADQMRLILKVWNVRGEDDLDQKIFSGPVVGIVDDGLYPLPQIPTGLRKTIEESYPGIDIDNCRLLLVGGMVPTLSRAKVLAWIGGGLVAGSCIAWFLTAWAWILQKRKHGTRDIERIAARAAIDQSF